MKRYSKEFSSDSRAFELPVMVRGFALFSAIAAERDSKTDNELKETN